MLEKLADSEAYKLIKQEAVLVDLDLFDYFIPAEKGCIDSQLTLIEAFDKGLGAQRSSRLQAYFEDKLFETTDDNRVKLGITWNQALKAGRIRRYDEMKQGFNKAIDFMQMEMPMEDWDFELFEYMELYTQGAE